jgi:hypothetical protein
VWDEGGNPALSLNDYASDVPPLSVAG